MGRGPGRDCPRLYQSLNTVAFAASRVLQCCASVVWRVGAGQRRGRLSMYGEGIFCAVFGAGARRGVAAMHGVQVLSVCNIACIVVFHTRVGVAHAGLGGAGPYGGRVDGAVAKVRAVAGLAAAAGGAWAVCAKGARMLCSV